MHLVVDRALIRREELELDLLRARVLRELLVAHQLVGLDVDEQDHPLLGALEWEARRVHRHRLSERLRGKAELAALRVALLGADAPLLGALEVRIAPAQGQGEG